MLSDWDTPGLQFFFVLDWYAITRLLVSFLKFERSLFLATLFVSSLFFSEA